MTDLIQQLIEVDKRVRQIDGIDFRFRDNIEEWISHKNKWILYPAPTIESRQEAISAPVPNIWVGLYSDDPTQLELGMSYQTKPLVQTFLQLDQYPNRDTRSHILKLLKSISDGWNFKAHQKTRWGSFSSSPEYDPREIIPCNTIDEEKFIKILALLRNIQETSHKRDEIVNGARVDYQGAAFDFMTRTVSLNSDHFVPAVREIFAIFNQCLAVKDSRLVELELREVRSEINLLKGKIEEAKRRLRDKTLTPNRRKNIDEKLRGYEEEVNSYPENIRDPKPTPVETPAVVVEKIRWLDNTQGALQVWWKQKGYGNFIDVFSQGTFSSECQNEIAEQRLCDRKTFQEWVVNYRKTIIGSKAILRYSSEFNDEYKQIEIDLGEMVVWFTDNDRTVVNHVDWSDYDAKDNLGKECLNAAITNWDMPNSADLGEFKLTEENVQYSQVTIRNRSTQGVFKSYLRAAYQNRCCISGCGVSETLEACHIVPVAEDGSPDPRNGILLRSDIHKLFDCHLLKIDPNSRKVIVDISLKETDYFVVNSKPILEPAKEYSHFRPHKSALARRWAKDLESDKRNVN